MIPRIQKGNSFKGAGLYYLHDKKADTNERVAWTHAMNTLHDEPHAVLREMQWVSYNQQHIKREAGGSAAGRPKEDTVMTIALAWHAENPPGKPHMK